jgi:hypothetical protein
MAPATISVYRSVYYIDLPASPPRLARAATPKRLSEHEREELIARLRRSAAPLGANTIIQGDTASGTELVAIYVATDEDRQLIEKMQRRATERLIDGILSGDNGHIGEGRSGSNGPVHVRGYTRKDGTYVKPHTRSRPNTK